MESDRRQNATCQRHTIHIWDKPEYSIRNWERLVREAKAPIISSGILQLTLGLFERLAKMLELSVEEVVEQITGQDAAWDFKKLESDSPQTEADWERDVASIDSAILALLDAETNTTDVSNALDAVLEKSLFARQLEQFEEATRGLIRAFVAARATSIWARTKVSQRKGYHAAGVGFNAGQFLDGHLSQLVDSLLTIEAGVILNDADFVANATVAFADQILQIAPFRPPKGLPEHWKDALDAWMRGAPSAQVIALCADEGVDVLQEAFTYRLP